MGPLANPTQLVLMLHLLVTTERVLVHSQSDPQLNFHFVAPNTGRIPETHDVHIEQQLDDLLYGLMCKSSGNRFTVRIGPSDSTTNLIDDSMGYSNATEGAKKCLLTGSPEPVTCQYSNFCTLGNICTVTIKAVCPRHGKLTRWMMTQAVDVTLEQIDGKVMFTKCFTICEPLEEAVDADKHASGVSYLTISLVVVGAMLAASLLVLSFVIWKIRDARQLKERERNRVNYVQDNSEKK